MFKERNLRDLAEMIVGDNRNFRYLSSTYITQFFDESGLSFKHDGSTRWAWTADRLRELLNDPLELPNTLPSRFVNVLRVLMQKGDAMDHDRDRSKALSDLNKILGREGFEAFYGEDQLLYIRHLGTHALSVSASPHRPFTPTELKKREELTSYLDGCSEDDLITEILLPLFRHLGFQRISIAGHRDKSLEYGKDVWMRFYLPTQHVLYFGLQVKRGKIDSAANLSNSNIAEIHNQVPMMLGHEIFDAELNKRALVDHAFIVAGGEITKAAKNWLGERLDAARRSQIMFLDREDILNLFVVANVTLPRTS